MSVPSVGAGVCVGAGGTSGAGAAVTEGDFRATGADYSELTGAIDYVNAIPGMKFSLILSEKGGKVKGSLRTLRDDVDVSEMAGKFSGGGHKKAAGFALSGKLQPEVRWKVVGGEGAKRSKNHQSICTPDLSVRSTRYVR